jgi:large subunit ribosomal protein L24
MAARIKRDDTVMVVRGRDRGKRGKVQQVFTTDAAALVEGVNVVKRHQKAGVNAQQGGIIDKEMPIALAKLLPVCPSCDKPTRVGYKVLDDGTRSRVCKHCEGMFN